jgi:hypothetical protein
VIFSTWSTAGRITKITSQMGTEERQYGKLGEVVYEKKTVTTFTNATHPSVYETRFLFDTFGRMLRITYPVSCPPVRRAGSSSEQAVFRRTKSSNDADFCLVVRLLPVFSLSPPSTYD